MFKGGFAWMEDWKICFNKNCTLNKLEINVLGYKYILQICDFQFYLPTKVGTIIIIITVISVLTLQYFCTCLLGLSVIEAIFNYI